VARQRQPTRDAAASGTSPAGVVLGWLAAGSKPGRLLVDYPGNAAGALPATALVALDAAAVTQAVRDRRPAALGFAGGDPRAPILLGLVVEPPSLIDELLATPATAAPGPAARPAEARLDGKRVVLEGKEEVVLRCGNASITLRRDGKLIIRGAYVETRATGINRIKGGAVKIN
jgi:hypothetical protein